MNPDSAKNRKLIKQYPFLATILNRDLEPRASAIGLLMADLTIKIQKADGEFMYRRADNVGLDDSSYLFQTGGNREGQVMRRGEYAFAVDYNDEIINHLNFPRNDNEKRDSLSEIYVWAILYATRTANATNTGYLHTDSLMKETRCIVWVTVEAWHTDTQDDSAPGSRFGEFRDRSVHITIYNKPDEGFSKLQENTSVYEHLQLDSRLITRGIVDKNTDILQMQGMLHEICIMFQDLVYFDGMKDVLDNGEVRGASGQFGNVKVLCAEMCGYDRVMLEDSTSYVTFQLRPDSKHMYVLGQQGTLPQIRNLVRTVIRMWGQNPEVRDTFQSDKKISVM